MKTNEKQFVSLEQIKTEISQNIGKNVHITESNKQGKKVKEFSGEIVSAYACLFVVKIKIKENFLNKSFSYIDFLTKELSFEIIQ